jgi:tetratricopeptide (TPR) repeat protein
MFLGQPEAALAHLEKSLQLNPRYQNVFYRYFWLGTCHLLLGHTDEAIDLLRKGRAADPQRAFTHLYLAAALGLRGDVDEARTSLAEALRLDPKYGSIAQVRADLSRLPGNPQYVALREKTTFAGLRRAGMPDE